MNNSGLISENNGRFFLKQTAITAAMLATTDFVSIATNDAKNLANRADDIRWYRRVMRWGQINITQKDSVQYDIACWQRFWRQTNTEGMTVNAGGIVAYYPMLSHPYPAS